MERVIQQLGDRPPPIRLKDYSIIEYVPANSLPQGVTVAGVEWTFYRDRRCSAPTPDFVLTAGNRKLRVSAPSVHRLCVLNGGESREVLEIDISGEGAAVLAQLQELPKGTVVVYIGDDGNGETALAVLRKHVSIRVGETRNKTANFYLRGPSEVLQFLRHLEPEISRP